MLVELIGSSVKFSTPKIQQNYYNQVEPLLENSLFDKKDELRKSPELEERLKKQDETIMLLKKENSLFQNLIRDLQSDNDRMKSLLEEDKQDGAARKFTFIEIINYCKDGVDFNDAKEIVNMMNFLLRGKATKEDYALLDSVREYFKNKKYGNTYIKEQTVIPSVSNYKPDIQTQNVGIPPVGQQPTKQIRNE